MEKPRTFAHFPEQSKCPVCGTNRDAECILLSKDGTEDDGIVEAVPVHLWCAVATNYREDMNLVYKLLRNNN